MTEAQTALANNNNEKLIFRKPSWLLTIGLVVAPFFFVWFLLRKGYSPLTRVLAIAWTIFFTGSLQLLQNPKSAEPQPSQTSNVIASQSEPAKEVFGDGISVTKRDFEARGLVWPLTVEAAHIGCDKGILLWIAIDGEKYGLNGTAIDWGYPTFRPFWRDNAEFPTSGSGPKVLIQDLSDAAKATCSTSG